MNKQRSIAASHWIRFLILAPVRSLGLIWLMGIVVLTGGCENNGSNGEPFDLDMLVGKWEDISKQNAQFEEWQWDGNGGLIGQGFVMAEADTVFIENLSISEVNGLLTYVARVSNQNEDQPVNFGLFADEGNRLIFENRQHDFPQRIVYEIISKNEMAAYIEGIEDGTFRQIKFSFQRLE